MAPVVLAGNASNFPISALNSSRPSVDVTAKRTATLAKPLLGAQTLPLRDHATPTVHHSVWDAPPAKSAMRLLDASA